MYIRRKVFSRLWDEETNEEKLFSVNEIVLGEDRVFSEKQGEEKKSKIRTAGKIAAIGSGTVALGSGITTNVIADKLATKVAKKYGVEKLGLGAGSGYYGVNAKRAADVTEGILGRNKIFKAAIKADKIGTGIALAGTAAYLYGRHKDKKNKKEEKK